MKAYNLKIFIFTILVTVFLALTQTPANAVLLTTTLEGQATFSNGGSNPFGLADGDTIHAELTWDDTLVAGVSANEEIFIDGLTDWDFTITLGSFSFSQSDVNDTSYTVFWFNMGAIDGISFFLEDVVVNTVTGLLIEDYSGGQSLFVEDLVTGSPVFLEADWFFDQAVTNPAGQGPTVPVPASLLLLSSGLIGIAATRRKTQPFDQ